ncbi:putative bifunctional diguanylate cyclase/phosphodiesterase [Pseudidiomarina terrestris]|uniref:putative bifunctional diguanylate cyclase/phosphodiesterase n=1 Tax=Pseudidiomarina terrestris TaxID=2820060 RepID=UPI0026561F94|nr:bifunctional diguanylate cyclase/phosphodiesterase [Pseudidiomarina sp. 1ASP75-5]MDN7135955.1 EAL domain-containing protein [Pseudidiomarina sp. 1ASP75-5]
MNYSFTQTAANKAYVSVVCFFIVLFFVGLADSLVLSTTFLMGVVPIYVALFSAAIALFLIIAFRFRTPPKLQRCCHVMTLLGATAFTYLQLVFWQLIPTPEVFWAQNPVSMSIITMMVLMLFIGLFLRLRYPNLAFDITRSTLVTCIIIVLTGVTVWYGISYQAVAESSENARTKIHLIGDMINKRLEDQVNALGRIKVRLDRLGGDDFDVVTQVDMENYVADYRVIEGMLLLDEDLTAVASTPFAKEFKDAGLLGSEGTQAWLQTRSSNVRLAANASSLDTPTPTVMVSVPIDAKSGAYFQLIALLNMNALISTEYLDYLSSVRTYLEFSPELLISMHGESRGSSNLAELENVYRHSVTETVTLTNAIDHNFHSYLVDYSDLEESARFKQLLLWLTMAFGFIFILAADNTRRLRENREKLEHMATYDDVTGLLRRDAFNQQTEALRIGCEGCHRAVIFVNLDAFNSLNKTLGHDIGDVILAEIAKRIKASANHCDILARFSSDEFILYYRDTTAHKLKKDAKAVLSNIADVYKPNDMELHLTASAGIAVTSQAKVEAKTLIQQADIAMNIAKLNGGNQFAIYQSTMADERKQLVAVRNKLQTALNKQQLEVFYQPIFSAEHQRIVSVESLVRWRTEEGFISPGVFIPIAEKTGQIIQLGELVLDMVLRDIQQYEKLQGITVAVNISPQQLTRIDFIKTIGEQLNRYAVTPSQLTLELTESVISDGGQTEQVLKSLRALGFHVAIDDFGTGFSSLSYLTTQPSDIIKIDRAFTFGVETEGKERNLLSMIVQICKQLEKTVVIEGVETQAQVDLFKAVGCDRLQGFYLGKPMPLAELIPLLQNQDPPR